MKSRLIKRVMAVVLSLSVLMLSVFTGVTTFAEEADTYQANRVTIHPGIDETHLNFSWHSQTKPTTPTVRIKASGAEDWTVFTGTTGVVRTSESGHQDGYHDTFVKNCGHTCSAVCGHEACTASQCYHGIYADPYYNRVTVSGLEFGVSYTYQLGDGTVWSKEYTTQTSDSDPEEDGFEYLVFGDSQTADQYYGDYMKNALELAVERFPGTDFMMNLGDNIHENNNRNYNAYFTSQDILAKYPIAVVMGNHELNLGSVKDHPAFTFTNPPAANARQDHWFRYGDVLFITFNSGTQTVSMMEDLDQLISDAIEAHPDARWKILQTHQGFYSNNGGGKAWRRNFVPVISKYDIDVVFLGHHHLYTRTESMIYPENPVSCEHSSSNPDWNCENCSGYIEELGENDVTVDEVFVSSEGTETQYTKTIERNDPEGITYVHLDSLTAEGHDQYYTGSASLAPTTAYTVNTLSGQGAITHVTVDKDTLKVDTYWINNNGTQRINNSADITLLDDDFIDETPYDTYTIRKTTAVKPVEVTFDGGSDRGIFTRRINAGETVAEPENPVLAGKSFKYWSLDGETPYDFTTILNESVTITAVYEDIPPITTADLFVEAVKRGDSEIVLESDITLTDKDLVTIGTGTTIKSAEGQRYTITLDGSSRLATANGSKVTLEGINITLASTINTMSNGYDLGGYIKVGSSSAKLYIYDCNIHSETTTLGAPNAAIIRPSGNSVCYVYIENSKITSNLANEKGALVGGLYAVYYVKDSTVKAKSGSWLSADKPTMIFRGDSTYTGWYQSGTTIRDFTNTTVKAARNAENLVELSKIGSGVAASDDNYKIYYSFDNSAFADGTAIEYTEPIADVDYETPIYVAIRYSTSDYYSDVEIRYCGEYIAGVAVGTEDELVTALEQGESVITITSDIEVTDKTLTLNADTSIQSKIGQQYVITLKGTSLIDVSANKQLTLKDLQIIVDENAAAIDDGYWYGYITVRNGAELFVYNCHIEGKATNYGSSTASLIRVTHSDTNPGNVYVEGSTIIATTTPNGGGALNGTVIGGVGPTFNIVDTDITGDWIFYEGYVILDGTTTLKGNAYTHNAVIYDFSNTTILAKRNAENLVAFSKIGSGSATSSDDFKIYYSLDKDAFLNGTAAEYTGLLADIGYETPVYVALRYGDTSYFSRVCEIYCGEYIEGFAVATADDFVTAVKNGEAIITLTSNIVLDDLGEIVITANTTIQSKTGEQYSITLDGSSRLTVNTSKTVNMNEIKVFIAETANTISSSDGYYYGFITVKNGAKLYINDSHIEAKLTNLGSSQSSMIKIYRQNPTNGCVYIENSTIISPSGQNMGAMLNGVRYDAGTKPTFRVKNSTLTGNWVFHGAYIVLEGTVKINGVGYSNATDIQSDFRNVSVTSIKGLDGSMEFIKSGTGSQVENASYKIYYSTDKDAFTSGTPTEYTESVKDLADATVYVAMGVTYTYKNVANTFYSTPVEVTTALLRGDIDKDGKVNAIDLAEFRKNLLNDESHDAILADANGDGDINIKDLVRLKKYVADID